MANKSRRARAKPVDAVKAKAKLESEAGKNTESAEVDAEAEAKAALKEAQDAEKKRQLYIEKYLHAFLRHRVAVEMGAISQTKAVE